MKGQIEKPLTVIIDDFKKNFEKVIAESQLPYCIIEPIILNFMLRIMAANEDRVKKDRENFEHKEES